MICDECHYSLPWHQGCARCGNSLIKSENHSLCAFCAYQTPSYAQLIAIWEYAPPIDRLISQFKFNQCLQWRKFFSKQLFHRLTHCPDFLAPDLIVPVPLHPSRLKQRGYNQAQLLAEKISKYLKIPSSHSICERIKKTKVQHTLPQHQRNDNLSNAFKIKKPLNQKKIAILDDVVTTGHTVNHLSEVLLAAGASQIQIWCIAKTYAVKATH